MRYVDPRLVERAITVEWLKKAKAVRKEAEAAAGDREKLQKLLSAHSGLWRELKAHLAKVMHGKCWYCETRQDRSDDAVDHFRPKGRVYEEKDHPGYWWLAFDHTNYRYSCTFCNSQRIDVATSDSGGKQDHFPLMPEGVRAWSERDLLEREKPKLLDPCRAGDPHILFFDETGVPSANSSIVDQARAQMRVEASSKFFHWNHTVLAAQRRVAFKNVEQKCAAADAVYRSLKGCEGEEKRQDEWFAMVQELSNMCAEHVEYSAASKCALLGLRTTSPSADLALSFR